MRQVGIRCGKLYPIRQRLGLRTEFQFVAIGQLGSVCSGGGNANFGIILHNNTGAPIHKLTVTYTGEAWKQGTESNKVADGLYFSYQKKPSDYISSENNRNGIPVEALNFIPTCTGAADYTDVKIVLPWMAMPKPTAA